MANHETAKEAWEKLPAYKKTWIKIVAVVVAIGLILGAISIIQVCNQMSEEAKAQQAAEKALMEARKAMREAHKGLGL